MLTETTGTTYGLWGIALAWIFMFGAFVLFVPLYRKADRKTAGVFLAFVIAFALEMYGAPFSLYLIMWLFGKTLPEGIFWGYTLAGSMGMAGHYFYLASLVVGGALIVAGWARIHRDYWSREEGEGRLVTEGFYRFIRHPQYSGFILISIAVLVEWATIPLLLIWPVLMRRYYKLARQEERELEHYFGEQWRSYAASTGMFLPRCTGFGKSRTKRRRG